jgi:signal transduction histidine kinase
MRRSTLVVLTGLVVTGVLAALLGLPLADGLVLVALSIGVGALCFAVGSGAIALTRRRLGLAAATVTVALIPVVSLAAGALVAAQAMFVSSHDLSALVVIAGGAGTAGVLAALALARQLAGARRDADRAAERERLLEQSRRELVAWVSHDLRTPLAGIQAMVEAIDDGIVDDDTVRRYHHQMARDVDTLSQLIDDLFELSRIEANALELTFEPVAIGTVVSDAVNAVATVAQVKGITVATPRTDPQPLVAASTRELTRVVHNLLDNAIKHTPRGGRVVVEITDGGEEAVISVVDECGGLPDQDLDRVFDMAYRGDHARSPGGGSGLGLAIARGFVEAHRGHIDVLNVDGGCCFTVRLPRVG